MTKRTATEFLEELAVLIKTATKQKEYYRDDGPNRNDAGFMYWLGVKVAYLGAENMFKQIWEREKERTANLKN